MSTRRPFRGPRGRGGRARSALLLGLALAALGCASTAPLPPRFELGAQPWLLPASAYGTQRLLRFGYRGPQGDGSFRATLRLAAADRFELLLVDPLGRQLALLRVEEERALFVDLRRRTFCAAPGEVQLPGVGPLPVRPQQVPAVLLGALPVAPPVVPQPLPRRLEVTDEEGRLWSAVVEDGRPRSWRVRAEGAAEWAWTVGEGRSAVLRGERGPVELRWEEVVVEPLRRAVYLGQPPAETVANCAYDLPG